MLNSRENFFHNLGKSEVFQRAIKREKNPRAMRKADFLAERTGVNLIEAVKGSYESFLADPENPKKALNYCKWRLRLHQRLNNNREQLELLNDHRELGLNDDRPGSLCWEYEFPFQG